MRKEEYISLFRKDVSPLLASLEKRRLSERTASSTVNREIKKYYENQLRSKMYQLKIHKASNSDILNEVLLMTYASDIIMLESRNRVWPYEYMSFARRIGELWEPFCKLTFKYPVIPLKIITPPNFQDVQETIKHKAFTYIDSLSLPADTKEKLKRQYEIPWTIVDSGEIRLALDLHFEQNGIHYNCDFKSGFSSNEKGNTNRLLIVGSIYNALGNVEKTLLFVRQDESENNHYLQTLKNSPYWEVYCADDCYEAMKHFTGFDLRNWIDRNVDWESDISPEFRQHLTDNDLLKYLTW